MADATAAQIAVQAVEAAVINYYIPRILPSRLYRLGFFFLMGLARVTARCYVLKTLTESRTVTKHNRDAK